MMMLLLTILFSSCHNNIESVNTGLLEITSEPVNEIISVSPDSLLPEKNPQYSIDYTALKLTGADLGSLKYYCLCPKYNDESINWIYNTEKGSGSSVSVKLTGTTNIYRLRAMTYGDGIISAMEIPVKNNTFEAEIPVAFSHVDGITLKTKTELILYGTVGLPIVIQLKNPKNLDDVSYLKWNRSN